MTTPATPVILGIFRLDLEVGSLDEAEAFYSALLATKGQRHAGQRIYFKAGAVTLQVLDVTGWKDIETTNLVYFNVDDLDAVFARATSLGCLSDATIHGQAGGEISVRPWGERSFYAKDPWGNPLCFVERGTEYL